MKEPFLKGAEYVLSTIDKIPGVNLITSPILEAVKNSLGEIEKKELYEYIFSVVNSGEEIALNHLVKLQGQLKELKHLLLAIEDDQGFDITKFGKTTNSLESIKLNLNTDSVISIEHKFIEKVEANLSSVFPDKASAQRFYLNFEKKLKRAGQGSLLIGTEVNIGSDPLIFLKIFRNYEQLSNINEKRIYIRAVHDTHQNATTKDWLNFLDYLQQQ